MQEGWLWERRPGRLYGSTWKRRWCEVNGGRLRVYDANKAREVATIHIRAETTLCDRLTEDEVRRVGRAPQAGAAAVYFRLVDRVGGRSLDFAAESEADAARWIAAITPTPVGDLLSFDVPGPVQPPPPLRPSLSQPPPPQPPQPARQPSEPVLATGRVLATVAHAWKANEPWQIDADAEEVVEVLGGPDQDGWVEVRSPRRGGSGAIPASYLASTAPDAPGAAAEAWERATETAARPPRPEAAESDQHERVAQEYIDARQRWGDPQAHIPEGERVQLSDRSSEASSSRDRPLRVLAVTLNCGDAPLKAVELRAFLRHGRVARRGGTRDVLADVVAVTLQEVKISSLFARVDRLIEAHLSQHERVPNACIAHLQARMFLLVFRRRDVAVSDATHGRVITGGLVKGACCAALTCAIADRSYRLAFIGCHLVTVMLERLNDALRKILDAFQSLLSSEAVVFTFGDLDYRIHTTYDDALKDADAWATVVRLTTERSVPRLAALDELTRQPQVNIDACGLAAFWTPELNFLPTFKCIKGVAGLRYDRGRVPSYTDRVLFRPGSNTDVTCVAHENAPAVTSSDHKPVLAAFEISAGFGNVHGDIVDLATSGSDEPPPAAPARPEAAGPNQHARIAQEIDARQRWGDPQAHIPEGERVQLSDRSSEASSSRDRPLRVLAVTLNCSDALPRTVELRAFLRHGRVARRGTRDVLADVVAVTLQDVGRCAPILVAMIEAHLSQHERVPNACIKYLGGGMRSPESMFLLVFRRRDVEVSDATHGPVIDEGLIKGACCAALTCAVADKSYRLAFIGCHLVTGMLERLNDALRKILDAFQSFLSGDSVVFMFGDLNYRINRTYDDALKDADAWATVVRLANERSIPRLAALDGLTRQPQVNIDACGLAAFWTPALNFLPTSPVRYIEQVKLHRFGPTLFKKIEYKIPVLGYTDRVLFRPGSNTDVTCVAHESVPAVTSSDHKPVSAAFEISVGFGNVHGDIVDLATSGSDEPPPAAPARPGAAGPIQHAHIAQEIDARQRWGDPQAHIPEGERVDRLSDDNVHRRSTWTRSRPSASAPATTPPPPPPPAPQSQKNQEHAALIADVQWTNVYAAKGVDGVTHSDLLMTRRHYRELAEGHERDLVHELRDYEASGGDLDAIRRHIDDAASARVWDMFVTNYKRFLRTGDAS